MEEDRNSELFHARGKLIITAVATSFALGLYLLYSVAFERPGDPIPVDAAPHYYIHDAG